MDSNRVPLLSAKVSASTLQEWFAGLLLVVSAYTLVTSGIAVAH